MRIATWNINGLKARLDFVLHWLDARKPDIVAIQELKLTEDKFPRLELEAAGYHSAAYGQKSWNGVAVLSRSEIDVVQRGVPGEDDFGARLITVETAGLLFTSVYVPNGKTITHEDFPKKLKWYDSLHAHLKEHDMSRQAVVGGDFNLCPGPLDTWDPEGHEGHIFHTDEERQRFRALLDLGYLDSFRELYPDERTFSWWDYRAGAFHKKMGLRIDFLLTTPSLHERVREMRIDRDYRKKKDKLIPSDHAPVIAELED